jgi:alkylhydroperoxidase family enzyme
MPARIAPAEPPYAEPVATALAKIMPAGVPPLALFRVVARNERVFARLMAGGLLDRGSLTIRERELVIDRTCARCGSSYELGVHLAFYGPKAGLTAAEIRELRGDVLSPGVFAPREELLLRSCDELHATSTIGDALWSELAAAYTAEQLVELVVLAGYYHTIAFVTNAFRIPDEPFATSR